MRKILFICTANTCRSAMAEAILKDLDKNNFNVKSAGIYANPGSSSNNHTVKVMREKDIDITKHKSTQVNEEILEGVDEVICMEDVHLNFLKTQYPKFEDKYFLIKPEGIRDPFGGSYDDYKKTSEILEKSIKTYFKIS
ncbi:low molecular weight protein arginine phosphatase [Methanobrevibacter sp. OttesenSCG-928-K11]|nr:low molecular weight protein arginine phosphatase [Methanobrevibacter sp. OttesenSCG-928-K11]MDL2271302.1 low molecular weight protein arginine phosphatase [Methanobrevibacter sp. OttesenSCG-928-I08]